MKRYFVGLWFITSSFVWGNDISQRIDSAKPLVRISLSRVLEVLGQYQEIERQNENPGALLLYTLDDRLEEMVKQLKRHLKTYQMEEGVRLDISQCYEDTLDYTDDFIEKMSKKIGMENE